VKAMSDMMELMKKPNAMSDWMANKRQKFEALPDNK